MITKASVPNFTNIQQMKYGKALTLYSTCAIHRRGHVFSIHPRVNIQRIDKHDRKRN